MLEGRDVVADGWIGGMEVPEGRIAKGYKKTFWVMGTFTVLIV